MEKLITNNFEETRQAGYEYAKNLHGGEVLLLYGELGAGKTTFMQGLAKGLGVTRNILSPTFIIMRTYQLSSKKDERTLYHVDLYRIESEKEVIDLGLVELMGDQDTIVAIEWPEKLGSLLPEKKKEIFFEYNGEDQRTITIKES